MAVAAPSALLVFDDGTTLPASKALLMVQSPVRHGAITLACNDDERTGLVRIALPSDSRADWVAALPYLYSAELEVARAGRQLPHGAGCGAADVQGGHGQARARAGRL